MIMFSIESHFLDIPNNVFILTFFDDCLEKGTLLTTVINGSNYDCTLLFYFSTHYNHILGIYLLIYDEIITIFVATL